MSATPSALISADWLAHLGRGPIGLGLDLATTDKGTSNPSSLSVLQSNGSMVETRLLVRWKTADDRVTTAVLRHVFDQLATARRKARALSVDSSNERFFSQQVRRQFLRDCPVRLIASGEKVTWRGEEFTYKTLLGTLYSGLFEDALITLPAGEWIIEDHRLVARERGSFVAATGKNGEHADTFDSQKLAYWSLVKTGRAQAAAASVTAPTAARLDGLKNPMLRRPGGPLSPTSRINS